MSIANMIGYDTVVFSFGIIIVLFLSMIITLLMLIFELLKKAGKKF